MKHYSHLLFIALTATGLKANAQCSSCTVTISSADAADHVVTPGTTLCVTATGSLSGLITVAGGGTLCNQGTISSSKVWIYGGTLSNYGTINTNNILVSNAGGFTNYAGANATIDSLLVSEGSSVFTNNGTLSDTRLAFTNGASGVNNGNITCGYFGDSLATFSNNLNLTVNYDLYNAYNSTFSSSNTASYLRINRDFYNSTGSSFTIGGCMVTIGGSWYNSDAVHGPSDLSPLCGGFNISGTSLNSGSVGSPGERVDLCDAGHPAGGIDGNTGSVSASTTYCSCANSCVATGITAIKAPDDIQIGSIYPNPAVSSFSAAITVRTGGTMLAEVYDMTGKKLWGASFRAAAGDNKLDVDVSRFAAGTYILKISDAKQLQTGQLFNVTR